MRKQLVFLVIFITLQIIYAVRSYPWDLTSGLLLTAGLIIAVLQLKYGVFKVKHSATS
ncbi:hypothetical protein [Alteromonas lipolytica]|uniref:hypothetical protein n=1 Tax=Alteromonas lipolytica TaxID=1856405 RepID=UPI001586A886|nr:hypothetical protein [Alteromonas lipolytica]